MFIVQLKRSYEKRNELVSRLEAVEQSDNTWMDVVNVFAEVVGVEPMIAAYTSKKDSWMKDVQVYWQQFDGQK